MSARHAATHPHLKWSIADATDMAGWGAASCDVILDKGCLGENGLCGLSGLGGRVSEGGYCEA